jgi:hypothetical protein
VLDDAPLLVMVVVGRVTYLASWDQIDHRARSGLDTRRCCLPGAPVGPRGSPEHICERAHTAPNSFHGDC